MTPHKKDIFYSTDMYLAAALLTRGHTLSEITPTPDGKRVRFTFEGTEDIESDAARFFSKTNSLVLSALTYADNLKSLKSRISDIKQK